MRQTIDEIVDGSGLPLSIIIVGIGSAQFDQMEELDADEDPLFSSKYQKFMQRDIVQFVPFRDVRNDPVRLAKEVLAEVPNQLTSYFQSNGIRPNPRTIETEQIRIQAAMKNQLAQMMQSQDSFFQ